MTMKSEYNLKKLKDYLTNLQQRSKLKRSASSLELGTMVLIKNNKELSSLSVATWKDYKMYNMQKGVFSNKKTW